ncbi:MAG: hypothetical protein IPL95_00380 [Saprospiraceae bacterium]|nr:hypothetical protein [Saprospiraceae bacterium]
MKHLVSTFIGIFLFFTASFAQVSDVEKTMSQGTKNGLSLDIKNVTLKSVEKDWKKFIKDVKKEDDKYDKKSKEYWLVDAKMPLINGEVNPVDVYVLFTENSSNGVNMTAFYDLGGVYLNSREHADKFKEAAGWMKKFATQAEQTVMKQKLEDEEDKLKDVEKKLKKLVGNNEDLHKDIENYKAKIKKAEADIETNLKDQDTTKKAIEEAKKVVDEAKKRVDAVKY